MAKDITSLLYALSERPLAGEGDTPSPEVEAFCRRAAEVMSREMSPDPAADLATDPKTFPALLAALYAGKETDTERSAFTRAAADSAEVRLESESALAFLDGIGERLEPAPTHLLGALATAHGEPTPKPRLWSFASIFLMRRTSSRLATAFALLVIAGGLSWSVYGPGRRSVDMAQGGPAATANALASKAASPAGGAHTAAVADSCAPGATAVRAATTAKADVAPAAALPGTACGSDADHQLADRGAADAAARERDAMQRAEVARQAEIAARREAKDASRKAAAFPAAMPASPRAYSYGSILRGEPPAAVTIIRPSAVGR